MNTEIRLLAIKTLQRGLSDPETAISVIDSHFILQILHCVPFPDTRVFLAAQAMLTESARFQQYLNVLFREQVLHDFKTLTATTDSVVRLRITDTLLSMANTSISCFNKIKQAHLLDILTKELNTKDPLERLNAIESLTKLIESQHGFNHFQESGLSDILCKELRGESDDLVMQMMTRPAIMKLFGRIGQVHCIVHMPCSIYLFSELTSLIQSDDRAIIVN